MTNIVMKNFVMTNFVMSDKLFSYELRNDELCNVYLCDNDLFNDNLCNDDLCNDDLRNGILCNEDICNKELYYDKLCNENFVMTNFGMGEDSYVLLSACCAASRGRTCDGAGEGGLQYNAQGMGEDVYFLERSDTYTVNPCVGEGRKYVSIIRSAAEDV